ncbi:hypothetical protein QFC22_004887 [Naganishia vaughanmartiniae]|uniref:Uncharacterized protein n=1 Tax=Naganishia vaughanmartiniae TaxID=1424756 RepID=A0ACC2WZ82_9TREE|nr:hypothetical protein QFC22_004887 [Naganishia vaughanmartiniae]
MSARYDFYQTEKDLIVSIYKKGLPADEVHVKATSNDVEVLVGSDSILKLSPLSGSIVADQVTQKVYGTKVELKLPKATFGNWSSLVGAIAQTTQATPTPTQPPKADESTPTNAEHDTTSATKPAPTRKNWDSLAKEIDEVEEEEDKQGPDGFFKSLYSGLDPDSQRAMLKSYQESNGTVLSTNWTDVGTKFQAPQPPAGTEVRKL